MNRSISTIIVMLLLTAGCSSGQDNQSLPPAPSSTQPVVSSTSTSAAPSATPESKSGTPEAEAKGVAYLRSPERIQRYEAIWPAATTVASAMMAGRFGPVEKYDDNKKSLASGYIGWGGMQTTDKLEYAWVYWNGAGNADLSKGVRGFSIGGLQIEDYLGSPDYSFGGPYFVFVPRSGYSLTSDTLYLGGVSPQTPFRSPTSLEGLKDVDNIAFDTLAKNLHDAGLS